MFLHGEFKHQLAKYLSSLDLTMIKKMTLVFFPELLSAWFFLTVVFYHFDSF